jgi:hypothetical protein
MLRNITTVFVTSFLFTLLIMPLVAAEPAMADVTWNYTENPLRHSVGPNAANLRE